MNPKEGLRLIKKAKDKVLDSSLVCEMIDKSGSFVLDVVNGNFKIRNFRRYILFQNPKPNGRI